MKEVRKKKEARTPDPKPDDLSANGALRTPRIELKRNSYGNEKRHDSRRSEAQAEK